MRRTRHHKRALAAGALILLAAAPAPPAAEDALGTYRLQGVAQLSAPPMLEREVEVHADAILLPGSGPGELRALLASEGRTCELKARLDRAGALRFPEGQRCRFEIDDKEVRGRIEARLRAGSGQSGRGRLALELSWELSGTLSLRAAPLQVPWTDLQLSETWTPAVPVSGTARATASGRRDESRHAG
jgi:hypothetical protein